MGKKNKLNVNEYVNDKITYDNNYNYTCKILKILLGILKDKDIRNESNDIQLSPIKHANIDSIDDDDDDILRDIT